MKKSKKRSRKKENGRSASERRFHGLALLSIVLLCTVLFANTFKNEFVYDDIELIVENARIKDWHRLGEVVRAGRPVREFTFMVDYHIWGLNPFGFHITNLLLHIVCSAVLYCFLNLIFKRRWVSLLAALLFAAHPINTEAVAGIANRKESLVMLFFMLSFIAYIKRDHLSQTRSKGLLLYVASIIFYFFALLSKQVAVALPVMLMVYDFYFRRESVKRNAKYYIPYFAIPLLGVILTRRTVASLMHPAYLRLSYSQILLTMTRAIVKYMRLVLLPHNLCADYSFPISSSITDGRVLGAIGILVASVGFIIWALRRSKETSFGAAWFLVNLVPVSNIIPSTYIVAERYLYVPSVGFCLVLSLAIVWLLTRARWRALAISLFPVVLLTYSTITVRRNLDWRSSRILWEKTVRQNPISRTAHNQLGTVYLKEGQDERAIAEFKMALQISPNWVLPHSNLAIVYLKNSRWDEAISESKKAIQLDPNYAPARSVLGAVYAQTERYGEAILELEKALEIDPSLLHARYNLGSVYARQGFYDEAISHYEKVLELDPNYPGAMEKIAALRAAIASPDTGAGQEGVPPGEVSLHYRRANLYRARGLYDEAVSEYEKVLERDPHHAATHYELGTLWLGRGEYDKAVSAYKRALQTGGADAKTHNGLGAAYQRKRMYDLAAAEYREALKLDPRNARAHSNLGALYAEQDLYDKAISEYRKAIEIDPSHVKAHNNLGLAYADKGLFDEAIAQFEKAIEIDPDYCPPYEYLAKLLAKKGLDERAQKVYEHYLQCEQRIRR